MKNKEINEHVWPYVLPFPLDAEKRGLIWSILQSNVGLKLIEEINVDKRTYQHGLVEKLPYSNKSIIKYLKRMVQAQILEQGMEAIDDKGRTVWVKWFRPTSLGKWLILFLKLPSEISWGLTKTAVRELFHLYVSSIVEVCQRFNMDIDLFHRDLNRQYLIHLAEKQSQAKAEVVVFGSASVDIYGTIERLPASGEAVFVEEIGRYPGGKGANVAVALSKLNVPVSFFGRVGSDSAGRMLLEHLIQNNVYTSKVRFADATSLQTIILSDSEDHRWLFTLGSPQSTLSLLSLEEIDWKTIDDCRVVYIGEVFTEIASAIAMYAKTRKKLVVYRPGTPYMRFGVEGLHSILEHTNLFVLNQSGWKLLQEASQQKMETPACLLKHGVENIIITKGSEGCVFVSASEQREFPVAPGLQARFRVVDTTGAGDGLSAGVIKGFLDGQSFEQAILYGQIIAAITCSRVGAGNSFPAKEEADATMDISGLSS